MPPPARNKNHSSSCTLSTLFILPALFLSACGGSGGAPTPPHIAVLQLTVNTTSPASGVSITASPADNSGTTKGTSSFTLSYAAGTTVILTAPQKSGSSTFQSWSGCTTASTVTCNVTMTASKTVTAAYSTPAASVSVTPNPAAAIIGTTVQFSAAVSGLSDNTVTWSVLPTPGSALSPGTISATGLYTTPYPTPAGVTVTATSKQDPTVSGIASVTFTAPATASAPALSVDAAAITHSISPLIYGMNNYTLDPAVVAASRLPLNRWGGDSATSYSYLTDTSNSAGDYYFENFPGTAANYPTGSQFNTVFTTDAASGVKTLGTIPTIGWTPLHNNACSFSVKKYGAQKATDPYNSDCGNGILSSGQPIANDPTDTYSPINQTFAANWVKFLVGQFGDAAHGGIAIYDLDNEPEWWDAVHVDIHPAPFTYDELTTKALAYAQAIKANDPTAEVSGPVISFWPGFFYSKKDIETGWSTGPCYCPNGNPTDRLAHGDIPLVEYYLQQFKKSEDSTGTRLLDYLDLHTYFAPNNFAFAAAGDTANQQARLNSTRVFWDPTYTDPNYTDPNNRTSSAQPYPPQLIPLMHNWIAKDYPGTKTAITEYNWGAQEHINGALAQADILGIFGREGLDLGALWGPPDPIKQLPGLIAFEVFRNYDGNGSGFGDQAITAASADQGKLAIYAARRTSDNTVTLVILNKTYGDLTGSVALANLTTNSKAKAFLYSNASLSNIVSQPDLAVTQPPAGSTNSSITTTFPAQSIVILIVPAS